MKEELKKLSGSKEILSYYKEIKKVNMNYKELLKKYMQIVIDNESVSFIDSQYTDIVLTQEEKRELLKIEQECYADR